MNALDLETEGFLVVRGIDVADDAALKALADPWGYPSAVGNGSPSALISEIRIDSTVAALHSKSDGEFTFHTDSTGYPRPHSVIVMGCLAHDTEGGGASILHRVDDVMGQLSDDVVDVLSSPLYEFFPARGRSDGRFVAPILESLGSKVRIRFRRDALTPLSPKATQAVDQLDTVLRDSIATEIFLNPGDVLVVDNRRVVHGRRAFGPTSGRHLRRLKLYPDLSYQGPNGVSDLWYEVPKGTEGNHERPQ